MTKEDPNVGADEAAGVTPAPPTVSRLTIGLDLDQTVYGFPDFFRVFIPAMHAAGCRLWVTSNHLRERWPDDCERLRSLGIDPELLDPHLMQQGPNDFGPDHKKWMAQHVDVMFDDFAKLNELTATPVFVCPQKKAADWRPPVTELKRST